MAYLFAALILLFCAPAFFIEQAMVKWMAAFAGFTLVFGAVALIWARVMPARFLEEHPTLAGTPLHPEMATLLGSVFVIFGIGLFTVLAARMAYAYFRGTR